MGKKIDLKREHRDLFTATKKVKEVRVTKGTYLAVEGQGRPGNEGYQAAIQQLYTLAYTTRFTLLREGGLDFGVCNLECLWLDDPSTPMDDWRWRLMIRIPDQLQARELNRIKKLVLEAKELDVSAVRRVSYAEGRALQTLHVGPYDKVGETYQRLGLHAEEQGLVCRGPGHEIYLSDPRRTAPEQLKTIVRMPVRRG